MAIDAGPLLCDSRHCVRTLTVKLSRIREYSQWVSSQLHPTWTRTGRDLHSVYLTATYRGSPAPRSTSTSLHQGSNWSAQGAVARPSNPSLRRSTATSRSIKISSPYGPRAYPGVILTIQGSLPEFPLFGIGRTIPPHTTPQPCRRRLWRRNLLRKYSCSAVRSSGVINWRAK